MPQLKRREDMVPKPFEETRIPESELEGEGPHRSRRHVKDAAWLLGLGLWNSLAPFVGTLLGFEVFTQRIVEVVDHVIPGVLVLLIGAGGAASRRIPLWALLAAALAGFWASATHLPLIMQAADGQVDVPTALWHAMPGIVLFLFAGNLALQTSREEADGSS